MKTYVCKGRKSNAKCDVCGEACKYELVWRRRKNRGNQYWQLDTNNSRWHHCKGCNVKQIVRTEQLLSDPQFCRSVLADKSQDVNALRESATRFGYLNESLPSHILYAAKNDLLNQSNKYYDEHWCLTMCPHKTTDLYSILYIIEDSTSIDMVVNR